MKLFAASLLALAAAQVPVDKNPYCCAGINDCEMMTGDACPEGPSSGPMSYGACIASCCKFDATADGVVMAACNATDGRQEWRAPGGSPVERDVTRNVGSGRCLDALRVDPVEVGWCGDTPASAIFAVVNGTVRVTGGMLHSGACLDDHGSVGLRRCETGRAAQRFAYDAASGRLSRDGRCLAVVG